MDEPDVQPLHTVHPMLMRLMHKHHVFPIVDEPTRENLTEDLLAEAIGLAISLEDHERQLDILSRIMSDKEVAVQGLQHPDIQNLDIQVALTSDERVVALREETQLDVDDPPRPGNLGDCLICSEEAHVTLPCHCVYCLVCLREAIRVGLRSEEAFPPRCCVRLGEATIRLARRPALLHLYRQLDMEYQTPASDRLYCYDGKCALFIPPSGDAECRACGRRTCGRCREQDHPGRDCGQSPGEEREEIVEDVWALMDQME
ncbi:hypothetical protein BGZ63DRAFT_371720 [Mariannaea sp. PMI_226]|nr:hypothetical protein BGZ63DRAFT_371720 [Mariannaea sp. PMI_226]